MKKFDCFDMVVGIKFSVENVNMVKLCGFHRNTNKEGIIMFNV